MDTLRESGIEVVGAVPWGTHFCQFYQTSQDLVETLVPYFREGLAAREFCMWVTSPPLRVEEAKAALRAAVPDLDDYTARGQIEILDYRDWYMKSGEFRADEVLQGWVDKHDDALRRGYEGLRLSGNTFWLEQTSWDDFAKYEETINNVIGRYRMLAICTYCLEKCGAQEIAEVVATHQFALIKRSGRWQIVESSRHRLTETALRESEERYRLLTENVTDVIWTADLDLNLTYISPSDQRLSGYAPQERIGLTAKEALTPTSLEAAKAALAEELAIEGREQKDLTRSRTMEAEVYRKDGSTVWAEARMTFLRDPDGRPVGILGVSRDISERKRAEQALRESERRFRTLSEASFEAIAIHRKGRMLEGNQALAAMFGYELSEVIGMHVLDFVAPESHKLVLHTIVSGYREPFEFTGLRKDGSTFPVEVCGRPIPYQGKMVTVAALRDITEHKQAEEALQKAREELEARVERQMERGNPYGLTFRELTVLHLVATGKADKEIASQLGISPLTASKHLANILSKMAAASRTEACVRALREGLLD